MSKAVLISILPNWVEKICSGEKTIEVRRTRPKIETPFKCYIYCLKGKTFLYKNPNNGELFLDSNGGYRGGDYEDRFLTGKVIGSFVCDKVDQIIEATAGICFADKDFNILDGENELKKTCLSVDELANYLGEDKNGLCKNGYAWHISDLKIYDKPKELGEFRKVCLNGKCSDCIYEECKITRPPQSWQYVEKLQ